MTEIDAQDDLAGRAAKAMAKAAGRAPDVLIEVTKRIPVSAGLGGGSSDAAAAAYRRWKSSSRP